jgi:SAM-dependent methyltransferase
MTPLPTPDLRERVGPQVDADEYVDKGRYSRDSILAALPAGYSFQGRRVLDFGCGAGRTLRSFLDEAKLGEFWGSDIHGPSIQWVQANLCPPMQAVHHAPVPPLPFDDESFDLVYALSVFTHITDDWSAWLLELRRILRPDGLLFATFHGATEFDHATRDFEDARRRPWDDDQIGMLVTNWMLEREYGAQVFHSEWWLREHWGRAFDVLALETAGFGTPPGHEHEGHGWVLLRPRPGAFDPAALEAPGPDLGRELRAAQTNLDYVHVESAQWRRRDAVEQAVRDATTRAEQLETELHAAEVAADAAHAERDQATAGWDRAERELDRLRHSTSWRLTTPVRWLGARLGRGRRG